MFEIPIKSYIRKELEGILSDYTHSDKLSTFSIEIPEINLLKWLESQKNMQRMYWSDRNQDISVAGIGVCVSFSDEDTSVFNSISDFLFAHDNVRIYGGMRFDMHAQKEQIWHPFPDVYFQLPLFEIRKTDVYSFVCNAMSRTKEDILSAFDSIKFNCANEKDIQIYASDRLDVPEKLQWTENITKVVDLIKSGGYKKIVQARRSSISIEKKIDAFSIVSQLSDRAHNVYTFAFEKDNACFLGASPEKLYKREALTLSCDSLAGTRKRGDTEAEDAALETELLHSTKDVHEQNVVTDYIVHSLSTISTNIQTDSACVKKLKKVQHLFNDIHAELNTDVDDKMILDILHPTPAVGGIPRNEAIKAIADIEQIDRGWYAAPVGVISKNYAEFSVAIRSGLYTDNVLHLFSGAGIVDASDPDEEWDEINNKLANFLDILNYD